MALNKVNYVDNQTIITAQNLNNIQDCVIALQNFPRNLLDNSDFTNPINQRGQTSYTGNKYTIDRWKAYHSTTTHSITNNGIHVSATDANPNIYQPLNQNEIDITRKMTAAACDSDGNIYIWTGIPSTTSTHPICVYFSGDTLLFRMAKSDTTWKWAALYYGEYTLETLPGYQPKGYAVELAECQRYYYQSWSTDIKDYSKSIIVKAANANWLNSIELKTTMRIKPSINVYSPLSGTLNVIADWATDTDTKAIDEVYGNEDRFLILCAGALDPSKSYYFHYSASADL